MPELSDIATVNGSDISMEEIMIKVKPITQIFGEIIRGGGGGAHLKHCDNANCVTCGEGDLCSFPREMGTSRKYKTSLSVSLGKPS